MKTFQAYLLEAKDETQRLCLDARRVLDKMASEMGPLGPGYADEIRSIGSVMKNLRISGAKHDDAGMTDALQDAKRLIDKYGRKRDVDTAKVLDAMKGMSR